MLNTIIIQGRLTKDIELRYTRTDKAVATFTVACDRGIRDGGADFITCIAWEKTAQFVDQYFSKGDMILVQGRLEQRNWEDSHGNKRTAHEVRVATVNFCGSKNSGGDSGYSSGRSRFVDVGDDDGELPF